MNLRVWGQEEASRRRGAPLDDPSTLPLRAGDQFLIEAKMSVPRYQYLVWIDVEGNVSPVFPWKNANWSELPEEHRPRAVLRLPSGDASSVWEIPQGPPGMETLLLLARESPLPESTDLEALLSDLPGVGVEEPRGMMVFENWSLQPMKIDRAFSPKVGKLRDPVLELNDSLKSRLSEHFSYTYSVSFSNLGR